MKTLSGAAMMIGLLASAPANWGAVSLAITKVPLTGGTGAGPPQDPSAAQGQWFSPSGVASAPIVRSLEFYDDIQGNGGGDMNHLAIRGYVTQINDGNWQPGQSITSFTVSATVTNDTNTWSGIWGNSNNSHDEWRTRFAGDPYVGPLVDSWLTIEFALADLASQPLSWAAPYTQKGPEIVATNEDGGGWYCYNQVQAPLNPGGYFVPAWDFGTIQVGQSATRDLTFGINGAIVSGDPRYVALTTPDVDILMNRTADLKIADWMDVPAIDAGATYPSPAKRLGNASLFHNIPEPSLMPLLGLPGFLGLRRRSGIPRLP